MRNLKNQLYTFLSIGQAIGSLILYSLPPFYDLDPVKQTVYFQSRRYDSRTTIFSPEGNQCV